MLGEDIYHNCTPKDQQSPSRLQVSNIISCWQAVIPSCANPAFAFNKTDVGPSEYAKTPYMPQLIEAARSEITEVIQTEFQRKGSQLKVRLVTFCTYKQIRSIGEVSYIDKY